MRALRGKPLLAFALLSFILLRLVELAVNGVTPIVTPDSGTYRISESGWLDFASVAEAKRPFVMTVVYALLPSDAFRIIAQSLFFTICWSMLLVAVYFMLDNRVTRSFGLIAFWLLGLSTLVSQWETLVLSESFTISLLSASIAGFLLWLKRRKQAYLISGIAALIVASLIRPQLFVAVAITTIAWWVLGKKLVPNVKQFLAAGTLLTLGLLLAVGQQLLNDANLSTDNLVNRTTWIYTNSLLPGSPFAERMRTSLPESAPSCIKPTAPLGDTAGQFLIDEYRTSCPEGLLWIKSDFQGFYLSFLVSDPISTIKDTSRLLWESAAMYVYGRSGELGPGESLTRFFALDQSRVFLVGLVVSLVTVIASWNYLRRRKKSMLIALATLVVAFAFSWVAALLLQIADLHRTSVTSIVPINILLLASFLIAIDGVAQATKPASLR